MSGRQLVSLVLAVGALGLLIWRSGRREPPQEAEGPDPAQAWVDGIKEGRARRSALTEEMRAILDVRLADKRGDRVELVLTNRGDREVTGYRGLLHLRDANRERVCSLELNESAVVPAGDSVRGAYAVGAAFRGDAHAAGELRAECQPFTLRLPGETIQRPWPSQSWWPWCQSSITRIEGDATAPGS